MKKHCEKEPEMIVDFHSHFLPGIDDGAEKSAESVEILKCLKKNGIETVCSTSHYSCHHESVDTFLERRRNSLDRLENYIERNNVACELLPKIVLGAEIHLYSGLSEHEGIDKLCLGGSDYILLEPPFEAYDSSVLTEIDNIRYQYNVKPIIAHINRYQPLYKKEDFESLFYREGLILQINCECANSFFNFSKMKKIIKTDLPCVFGCDIHSPSRFGECGIEKMKAFESSLPAERRDGIRKLEDEIIKSCSEVLF